MVACGAIRRWWTLEYIFIHSIWKMEAVESRFWGDLKLMGNCDQTGIYGALPQKHTKSWTGETAKPDNLFDLYDPHGGKSWLPKVLLWPLNTHFVVCVFPTAPSSSFSLLPSLIFSPTLSLCFHFALQAWGEQLVPATSSWHHMLPNRWPEPIKWTNQGLKLLKPWVPNTPFLLVSWVSHVFAVVVEIWLM